MRIKNFGMVTLVSLLTVGLVACEPDGGRIVATDDRVRLTGDDGYGDFGAHLLHVNGMTTASLTPEVAQSYGITRSETRGLVNLVVLEKSDAADAGTPVHGEVNVSAANLTGQLKNIEIREITDGDSIYYIGEVSVANEETIKFDFDVIPEGSDQTLRVRFTHRFYTR